MGTGWSTSGNKPPAIQEICQITLKKKHSAYSTSPHTLWELVHIPQYILFKFCVTFPTEYFQTFWVLCDYVLPQYDPSFTGKLTNITLHIQLAFLLCFFILSWNTYWFQIWGCSKCRNIFIPAQYFHYECDYLYLSPSLPQ